MTGDKKDKRSPEEMRRAKLDRINDAVKMEGAIIHGGETKPTPVLPTPAIATRQQVPQLPIIETEGITTTFLVREDTWDKVNEMAKYYGLTIKNFLKELCND